jgi:large subunit ribosomal protein L1|tara:strand:- start:17 stop:712 length:696 start_codon:yes stop_codon:yes gene_type:complete
MSRLTKNKKIILEKYDSQKLYSLEEASKIIKDISFTKFDASIDLDVRLGVDPKKPDQMIRGAISLPHGTGKILKVLALCTPDKEEEAKKAGADYIGLDDFIKKIENGWTDIDVIVTIPTLMPKLGRLGKVLGPRGLMPNPKSGTVTNDIGKAIKDVKAGKIDFKVDKFGIIHASIGKVSFDSKKINENAQELLNFIVKLRPSSAKGIYVKSVSLSSTMSSSIKIESSVLNN